jgi:large subunit ribosomal protein L25
MVLLKVNRRDETGTRKVKRLRGKGLVPGVMYGHGEDTVSLSLDKHDLLLAMAHGERLLELDIAGNRQNVLIKEIQYDTFGQEILHIDLARVDLDELVQVTVPIVFRGIPAGAVDGGVLQQTAAQVAIECMVRAIPDEIRVPVNDMKVGDVLHMRDLPLPQGAKLVSDPDVIVCSVTVIAEAEVAPAVTEVAATEPEVITERKPTEEEEAQEKPKEKSKEKE